MTVTRYHSEEACIECYENNQWSRGLCASCYSHYRRMGMINTFPTNKFFEYTDDHVDWGFQFALDTVKRIAKRYGYELVKTDGK